MKKLLIIIFVSMLFVSCGLIVDEGEILEVKKITMQGDYGCKLTIDVNGNTASIIYNSTNRNWKIGDKLKLIKDTE